MGDVGLDEGFCACNSARAGVGAGLQVVLQVFLYPAVLIVSYSFCKFLTYWMQEV